MRGLTRPRAENKLFSISCFLSSLHPEASAPANLRVERSPGSTPTDRSRYVPAASGALPPTDSPALPTTLSVPPTDASLLPLGDAMQSVEPPAQRRPPSPVNGAHRQDGPSCPPRLCPAGTGGSAGGVNRAARTRKARSSCRRPARRRPQDRRAKPSCRAAGR